MGLEEVILTLLVLGLGLLLALSVWRLVLLILVYLRQRAGRERLAALSDPAQGWYSHGRNRVGFSPLRAELMGCRVQRMSP